jgi:hypothetical protein
MTGGPPFSAGVTTTLGAPLLRFLQGRAPRTLAVKAFTDNGSRRSLAKRNFAPAHVHLHQSSFAQSIEPVTAPAPLVRRFHQPAIHRIAMHIPQLLHTFFRGPHVEVVEASLPERPRLQLIAKESVLSRVSALAFRQQSAGGALLQNLHHRGRVSDLRLTDEQMKMFGHHDLAHNYEPVALADLRESKERHHSCEQISRRAIAGNRARDKVQVMCSVGAMQASGHG